MVVLVLSWESHCRGLQLPPCLPFSPHCPPSLCSTWTLDFSPHLPPHPSVPLVLSLSRTYYSLCSTTPLLCVALPFFIFFYFLCFLFSSLHPSLDYNRRKASPALAAASRHVGLGGAGYKRKKRRSPVHTWKAERKRLLRACHDDAIDWGFWGP